ncbi:MAG: nuclear transport factor 2 family protein [Lautropia sp.]
MIETKYAPDEIRSLHARITALEAEADIRRVVSRYMLLCDKPAADEAAGRPFADLFTNDVIWEGVGERYARWFGRHEGIDNVLAFFKAFRGRERRFVLNVHYLGNEHLAVGGESAEGWWLLYEPVTDTAGTSSAMGARLHLSFRRESPAWRISHFRTENLFIADQPQGWNDDTTRRPRAKEAQ